MNRFDLHGRFGSFDLAAAATWDAADVALFGASGSGKSTVLEAIAGLRGDVTGEVTLLDRRLDTRPAHERGIGWVPQDGALLPHRSVRDNLAFASRFRGDAAATSRAIDALEIGPLLDRSAAVLSGGERQRVAIARALASKPSFLLLDEPLAAIDRPLRARIVPFLDRLRREFAIPYLLVTHDPLEVVALASHVLVLEGGRITATGEPRTVFAAAGAFGALHALGAENFFDVTVVVRGAGTARVRTPRGIELELALPPGFAPPSRVSIRAEDVLVAVEEPRGLSAQNVFVGVVAAIEPTRELGGTALVTVEVAGERFAARLTPGAITRLALATGTKAWIVMKAHSIHPVGAGVGE
jgi:molybdate transport system ATP-binding protein